MSDAKQVKIFLVRMRDQYKNPKIPKLQSLQNFPQKTKIELYSLCRIQNKNLKVLKKKQVFSKNTKNRNCSRIFSVFVKQIVIFKYWIRIRCIELYMLTWFKNVF